MAVEGQRAQLRNRDADSRAVGARGAQQVGSIIGLQRARLLSAAIGMLAEDGYAGFSAAGVCERAGVSRRTFYEVFENREQCLAAIFVEAEWRASTLIASLGLERLAWAERIRMGLWGLLCLADREPALARACLVESQFSGGFVRAARERILSRLVDAVDEGRLRAGSSAPSRLTAEALVGAVSSVIATRLAQATQSVEDHAQPCRLDLHGLLGELTGMIVLPYQGPAAARRQVKRELPEAPVPGLAGPAASSEGPNPLGRLPMRLTYRTARVIQAVAKLTAAGMGASNRQIAEEAGISDAGQVSKLLGRLQQHDLLRNAATGNHERGEANQWHLTETGGRVLHSITAQVEAPEERRSVA
ncbi:MAG TPA: TetR/AcrR family transcriptional regulator [Solirubrobacteraceae bacterium]